MNNLTMNNITTNNTIPIPIPIDTNEFDGHQFFLAKTISLACEVPIESVDTMNHLSPLSFLISTCLLVVAMNAVLILLAPVKAGLEYLHNNKKILEVPNPNAENTKVGPKFELSAPNRHSKRKTGSQI